MTLHEALRVAAAHSADHADIALLERALHASFEERLTQQEAEAMVTLLAQLFLIAEQNGHIALGELPTARAALAQRIARIAACAPQALIEPDDLPTLYHEKLAPPLLRLFMKGGRRA